MSYQLLIFLSIVGWGLSAFCNKIANNSMHPLMVTTVETALYVLLTPAAFIMFKFNHDITLTGSTFAILGAIGACVGSLCCFFAYKAGGTAGEVTALTALYPAFTLLLSCAFLGEPFTFKKVLGIALAIISCVVLGWK